MRSISRTAGTVHSKSGRAARALVAILPVLCATAFGSYLFGMRNPDLARAIVPHDGVAIWSDNDVVTGEYTGESYIFESLNPNLTNIAMHAEAATADPIVRWDLAYNRHILPLKKTGWACGSLSLSGHPYNDLDFHELLAAICRGRVASAGPTGS